MRLALLFNILLFVVSGIHANPDTVYFNAKWEQTIPENARYYRLITFDTTGKPIFHVKDYYISGKQQMEGDYRSINPDHKTGTFIYWYENGQKKLICNYFNNVLSGDFIEWYDNGNLKSQRFLKYGIIDGIEKQWSPDGLLKKLVTYKNGLKHGKFVTFYDNGRPIRKDIYKNDILIKGKCYTPQGKDTSYFEYLKPPQFSGGLDEFTRFITEKIIYPEDAKNKNEEGDVVVQFTINKDGKIINPVLVKKDKEYFNQEALRVIKLSPPWIPAQLDGKKIDMRITMPVRFRLK